MKIDKGYERFGNRVDKIELPVGEKFLRGVSFGADWVPGVVEKVYRWKKGIDPSEDWKTLAGKIHYSPSPEDSLPRFLKDFGEYLAGVGAGALTSGLVLSIPDVINAYQQR